MSVVMVVPDIHCPFSHKKAIPFLTEIRNKYKPDRIVFLGDELDFCSISRFPSNPDGMSAGDELNAGVEDLKKFYSLFPFVDVCKSNHGVRPFKKAFEAGIPSAFIKSYSEFLKAPRGWKWHDRVVIDGVQYIHGEGFTGQYAHVNAALRSRQSTVIGHIHAFGGVQYMNADSGQIFGMNCGCLIDEKAYAFNYSKSMPQKPTYGCGIVFNGKVANFIPLI